MIEYNEGDLVEAVKGDTRLTGRLAPELHRGGFGINGMGWPLKSLKRDGFTLTVIEKAAPKVVLPSEPGVYSPTSRNASVSLNNYYLDKTGVWYELESERVPVVSIEDLADFIPFTKLEPVSETAKKVLDAVWEKRAEVIGTRSGDGVRALIRGIEIDLGVTS